MRTFKKIITIALVLSMLAALFVPMGVSAAATRAWTNTSELWATNSNTNLEAVLTNTAPTLDGVKDGMWNNVQPLVINDQTRQTVNNAYFSAGYDIEIYMLYDQTNLYLLMDVKNGSVGTVNIVPKKNFVPYGDGETAATRLLAGQKGDATKFDGFMPQFLANGEGEDATIRSRRFVYQDNTVSKTNGLKEAGTYADTGASWATKDTIEGIEYSRIEGLQAKYTGAKGGAYVMECIIPWAYLGQTGPVQFGVKFSVSNYHLYNGQQVLWNGGNINWDCAYQDPVTLKTTKGATPKYVTDAENIELGENVAVSSSWTNTRELFAHDSTTDLGAIKTTTAPTIDGTKDGTWDNAYPLTLNNFTARTIANAFFAKNQDTKVYMLYDNTNLYLLAEVGANTVNKLTFNIVPEKDYVAKTKADATAGTADWDGFMPDFKVADSGENTAATPTITERNFVYKDNTVTATNGDKSTRTGDVASTTAIQAKYNGSKAAGWTMEIAIPWSYLDCATPTDFGIKVTTSGFHINAAENTKWRNGKTLNHDCIYFDPVELRDAKGDKPAYLVDAEAIEAAYTKYARDMADSAITEFEIGTKAELLAFDIYDYLKANYREEGEAMYSGKTFKLTADIDLNPYVDWKNYNETNAHWGIYDGVVPSSMWSNIRDFAGILDGQGHAINGLWINAYNLNVYGNGFIGEVYNDRGVAHGIRNLIIGSGSNVMTSLSDCNGGLVGSVRTNGAFFENIYIGEDFTLDTSAVSSTSSLWIGSLFGRVHDHTVRGSLNTITVKNCVFDGKFIVKDPGTSALQVQTNTICGTTNMQADTTYLNMTDVAFAGELYYGKQRIFDTALAIGTHYDQGSATSTTRVYTSVEDAKADTANAAFLANMTDGSVLPVAVADMISGMYAQNNDATKNAVRIVSEVSSLDVNAFGYRMTFKNSQGQTKTIDDTANTSVYKYVTAGGEKVYADNSTYFGAIDGDYLYAVEISGLNAVGACTVEITPVWTINGQQITGATRTLNIPRS